MRAIISSPTPAHGPRKNSTNGIEKPCFGRSHTVAGKCRSASARNTALVEAPRWIRAGTGIMVSITCCPSIGTLTSSPCAMLARSVFGRQFSLRYVHKSARIRLSLS